MPRTEAQKAKRRTGNPTGRPPLFPKFDPAIGLNICWGIACGKPLRELASQNGLPDRATVYGWVLDEPDFAAAYSRAREIAAHGMADDLNALADTANAENAQAVRLQVNTRQWVLARMHPKAYGDKLNVDGTITIGLEQLVMAAIEKRAAKVIEHDTDASDAQSDEDPHKP